MKMLCLGLAIAFGLSVPMSSVRAYDSIADPSSHVQLKEKLRNVFVSIDFTHASITEAIATLGATSNKADPEHKGVGFYVQPQASVFGKPITLKLNHVPVEVAIKYICELSRLSYEVNDHLVTVSSPFGDRDLQKRTFQVDSGFFNVTSLATATTSGQATP